MKKLFLVLYFVMFQCTNSFSQPDFVSGATTVKLSAKTLELSSDFPYDNPFVLLVNDIPKDSEEAELYFVEGTNIPEPTQPINSFKKFGDVIYMVIEFDKVFKDKNRDNIKGKFLSPNTTYTIKIVFLDKNRIKISSIQRSNYTRTKYGDYIKTDFGFGYSPHINGTIGFTTVHIYFAALNNDADLGKLIGLWKQLSLRTSIFFGISPLTIYSNTKQPINKLTGAGNFVYGLGIRSPFYGWYGEHPISRTIFQPMRLVIGQMVFTQNNANPFTTQTSVKQAFYIGLSYDFIIGSLFAPITKLYIP